MMPANDVSTIMSTAKIEIIRRAPPDKLRIPDPPRTGIDADTVETSSSESGQHCRKRRTRALVRFTGGVEYLGGCGRCRRDRLCVCTDRSHIDWATASRESRDRDSIPAGFDLALVTYRIMLNSPTNRGLRSKQRRIEREEMRVNGGDCDGWWEVESAAAPGVSEAPRLEPVHAA